MCTSTVRIKRIFCEMRFLPGHASVTRCYEDRENKVDRLRRSDHMIVEEPVMCHAETDGSAFEKILQAV